MLHDTPSSAHCSVRKGARRCCGSQDTLPRSQVDDAYLVHTWCSGCTKDSYSSLGMGGTPPPGARPPIPSQCSGYILPHPYSRVLGGTGERWV